MSESHSIAVAINVVKKSCSSADLNFPGKQTVNAKSRAQACAAVAQWEACKAKAKANSADAQTFDIKRAPKGKSNGGQFIPADGSSSGKETADSQSKSKSKKKGEGVGAAKGAGGKAAKPQKKFQSKRARVRALVKSMMDALDAAFGSVSSTQAKLLMANLEAQAEGLVDALNAQAARSKSSPAPKKSGGGKSKKGDSGAAPADSGKKGGKSKSGGGSGSSSSKDGGSGPKIPAQATGLAKAVERALDKHGSEMKPRDRKALKKLSRDLKKSLSTDSRSSTMYEREGATADTFPHGRHAPSRSLVAAAAPHDPDAPPEAFFVNPGFKTETPLTVTREGRVFGHLATWGACHLSHTQPGRCVTPPRSRTGYSWFTTGAVETAEGTLVATGPLTVGTGHASDGLDPKATLAHYDNTGLAVADVAVGEDSFGIWVSGALRPGVTAAQVRTLRASPLSGDWRRVKGNLELVAALAVNVPGFGIPRAGGRVENSRVTALVAAGAVPQQDPSRIVIRQGNRIIRINSV